MLKVGGGRAAKKFSASLIAIMTGLVVTAFAVPAHASAPGGPYGGFAQGTVAHLDALNVMGLKLANVDVGQSSSAVASEGLPADIQNEYTRPIVWPGFKGKNSYARASLLEVGLGLNKNDKPQIIPFTPSEVATSGGTKVNDNDPVHVPGSPLLWLDALHTTAVANWNPDTCVIGQPIAGSQATAASAQLVNLVSGTNANDSFPQALLAAGAIHSHSYQILYPGKGPGLGLASVTQTDAVHLALLQGTANEVDIDVAPAFLVTQADGTTGGAKVTYEAPIAKISAGGQVIKILTDLTGPIRLTIPPGAGAGDNIVLDLKLGTLLPIVSTNGPSVSTLTKPNGTFAQGSVNVLELTLLSIPQVPFKGATVSVGHLEAEAQVPEGGVSCPIPVTKTPDVETVESGHSFTTTIKIDNPWVCPLVLSDVADQIDTIEGTSTFQVTSVTPDDQTTPSSLPTSDGLTTAKVEWTKNLPTIPPGGSATFTVTLKTGGGAGKIKDIATAAGAVSNCKPAPGSGETEVTGITNVKVPVTGTGTFTEPETHVQGVTKLPRTGVADSAYTWAGLMMLLAALGGGTVLRRRKFKIEA